MHTKIQLQQAWCLQQQLLTLWQVPILQIKPAAPMGIPFGTRIQNPLRRAIHHINIRRRTLTPGRFRTKTYLSEIYNALSEENWLSTTVLRMYGIRHPIWPATLSCNILWREDKTDQARRKTLRIAYNNSQSRPANRGHLATRINLCEGIELVRNDQKHNPICSRLHFEKQMGDIIFNRLSKIRMGPHEPNTLYRQTSGEILIRKTYHDQRRNTLCHPRHGAGFIHNGWQTLPGTN